MADVRLFFPAAVDQTTGRRRTFASLTLGVCLGLAPASAYASPDRADIVVSVQDGKLLRPGEAPGTRTPDTLALIDISAASPRLIATIPTPASLIGPPTSLAVTPDRSLALVTVAQQIDPADGLTIIQGDRLTVVDISSPTAPRVTQDLRAGPGATGLTINPSGTLALVASTGDDVVSVFAIRDGSLSPVGRLHMPYQSRPTDVVFTPDGQTALVVLQSAGRLVRYVVDGDRLTKQGEDIVLDLQPTGVTVSRDGRFAFVTNAGGRRPVSGAPTGPSGGVISIVDLGSGAVTDVVDAGVGLEHIALSPDGRFLQVTLVNGSSAAPGSSSYNPAGRLRIFAVEEGRLAPVAETDTGQWCQGAAWSPDGGRILLQCALKKQIEVYRFDGASLERDDAATLTFAARPAAIVGATNR